MKFNVDFTENTPKYIILYNYIKDNILNNNLKPNEKLPTKRILSNMLNISQNTIIQAYNLLLDEGLITSIEKKGYYVLPYNLEITNKEPFEMLKDNTICYMYDLTTKNIDSSIFPYYTWNKLNKKILYDNNSIISKSDNKGSIELRNTISNYLYESKGIRVNPYNIIIGSGIEYLLTLLINILPAKTYAIENPGYDKVSRIIKNNQKEIIYSNIDNEGMIINNVEADAIYITPDNQFPTGVKMSLSRKLEIAKWVNEKRYVIEDDFDSEFKYLSNKSVLLYNLIPNNTILLSTYSRTISPALRISYMILPDELMKNYNRLYSFYSSTVSTLDQLLLNEFISEGYYSRHINKTKALYKQKRAKIISILEHHPNIKIDYENSYLSLIISLSSLNKEIFKRKALENKIDIALMDDYYFNDTITNKIIIGYNAIPIDKIDKAINTLIKIIEESK
ncbi:MAG: PLP-dependent aminotransferase family protein [Anaeroplasmataceae bacterium]